MGKIVGVPLIRSNKELEIKKIEDMNQLKIGRYDILEPIEELKTINPNDPEILFIPGIAFGINYERLGRGGGYFDIFLPKTSGLKVGLAYEFQIFDSLPVQEHDIKMDIIVTEKRIIRHV
jgi:5-formyltetrahydrofolate cyclo-ligase